MRENWKAIILTVAAAMSPLTQAITAPVPPVCETLQISWTLPTTRDNGAPLALAELVKTQLWLTNEAAAINVPAPAKSYTYKIPAGYTTTSTDAIAATVTDINGIDSAMSSIVLLGANHTCPKPLPGAPISLAITPG